MTDERWTLPADRLAARRRELMVHSSSMAGNQRSGHVSGLRAVILTGVIAVLAAGAMSPVGYGPSGLGERIRSGVSDPLGLVVPGR